MKKKILICALAVLCLMLSGCKDDSEGVLTADSPSNSEYDIPSDADVLEIGDNMFLSQLNDMLFNFDDYKDKTIVVEGMYGTAIGTFDGVSTPIVYRFGPGCCGDDGQVGFMLYYDGDVPKEDEWIKVIGTPEVVASMQGMTLYLNVLSMEVQEERGIDTVTQ